MNGTRKRFISYVIVGIVFGTANWMFRNDLVPVLALPEESARRVLETVHDPVLSNLILGAPLFLVWLMAAIPVILIEIRASQRPDLSAAAVTLFWAVANVTYYAIYTGKLLLGLGGPQLGVRLDQGWDAYWQGVVQLRIHRMVGEDFVLSMAIGLVGGPIVGWLGGFVLLQLTRWWRSFRPSRLEVER